MRRCIWQLTSYEKDLTQEDFLKDYECDETIKQVLEMLEMHPPYNYYLF